MKDGKFRVLSPPPPMRRWRLGYYVEYDIDGVDIVDAHHRIERAFGLEVNSQASCAEPGGEKTHGVLRRVQPLTSQELNASTSGPDRVEGPESR
jgi:hypothetical protein